MKKLQVRLTIFIAALFLSCSMVFADDASLAETVQQLQKRVEALEKKVFDQEKTIAAQHSESVAQQTKIAQYEDKLSKFDEELHREAGAPMKLMEGLELGVGATMIAQGTNNVNYDADGQALKKSRTDASYTTDITLSKEFKEVGGKAFLHLENGQGNGLEDNLTLYSNVNYDANDHVDIEVTELWYEQALLNDRLAMTFGKLDPTVYFDNNEVANDETIQFLGRIFRNSPTLEFPDNAPGIRLAYEPTEWIELGYGVFDGKSSWEKMGDNLFNIGQVAFKTKFFGLPGNYRFYGWNNNVYHTKWRDASKEKEMAYGFGLSMDQKATDTVTLFARYGWQDPRVYNPEIKTSGDHNYSLEQSWSTGLQIEGKPWGREKDMLAFAVGQVMPSGDYKKTGSSTIASPNAKTEGHFEAYYRIFVNDHLSLSPDFQYIWNPFGKDIAEDTSPIFVGGMRAQVDF